ncbi:hypothetical protein LBMAG53_32800 [Planctomycetota bacterium]|nr:hypothetical protein LBMAG53_32800 [Planctomycetota bacterium]
MGNLKGGTPIFIVGSERSGTTLLMALLGHHPRIAVPEVTWYYPRFHAFLHTYGDLSQPEHFRTLVSEMVFGLKTPFFGLPWNPRTIVDEIVAAAPKRDFASAFAAIIGAYAKAQHKPRWGEKTPHNLYYVRQILQHFPDAKILHLVRDGRDVAVEQLQSAFGPTNLHAAAVIWKRTAQEAARLRADLPATTWLDVRYEQLAKDPEGEVRKVLTFLGEAWDPLVLDFHQGEIARRRAKTRDHRQLGDPVNTRYIGIYRQFLSLHDQGVFAGVAGEELRASGYPVEVAPIATSAADAQLFDELDQRVRAATLDAPEGHLVYESYNDWLADQREDRRRRGIWQSQTSGAVPANAPDWPAEFLSGQRAPSYWKRRFAIPRRYEGYGIVL